MRQSAVFNSSLSVQFDQPLLNLPPLPERVHVNESLTGELTQALRDSRKRPLSPVSSRNGESLSDLMEQLLTTLKIATAMEFSSEVTYRTAVQQVEKASTSLMQHFCDETISSDAIVELDGIMRSLSMQLESELHLSIGDMELAVDTLKRVYIAFPLLRADKTVRARLTGPVCELKSTLRHTTK